MQVQTLFLGNSTVHMDTTNSLPTTSPTPTKKKKQNSYYWKTEFREEIMNIHCDGLEVFETDILTEGSIMVI